MTNIPPVVFPEGWDAEVHEQYERLAKELDDNGDKAFFWCLVNQKGEIQPWRLIIGKYNPVWQSEIDRSQFIKAFDELKLAQRGMKEVIKEFPASVSLSFVEGSQVNKFVKLSKL